MSLPSKITASIFLATQSKDQPLVDTILTILFSHIVMNNGRIFKFLPNALLVPHLTEVHGQIIYQFVSFRCVDSSWVWFGTWDLSIAEDINGIMCLLDCRILGQNVIDVAYDLWPHPG